MSTLKEKANEEESTIEFNWGKKMGMGGPNRDVQFYESFKLDGVEYSLYDCVYMWCDDFSEPYIGKLVKVWETPSHKNKVKTVWFFRPEEILNWLGDVKPLEKELFLASGEGIGVSNISPLESICGKCKVVCTSEDRRNSQASEEEVKMADYTFFRTFDVGNYKISDRFTNLLIAGHQVEHFFNKRIDQKLRRLNVEANLNQEARKVGIPARAVKDNYSCRFASARPLEKAASLAKKEHFIDKNTTVRPKAFFRTVGNDSAKPSSHQLVAKRRVRFLDDLSCANESDIRPSKKRMLHLNSGSKEDPAHCADLLPSLPDHIQNLLNSKHSYTDKRGLSKGPNTNKNESTNLDNKADQSEHRKRLTTLCQTFEVSRRPDVESDKWFKQKESDKWFKQKSWQESLERARETGCLILLENLEPSYTSQEVEDIIWHGFEEKVIAKMIQRNSLCSPHNGQALIILKSKDVADSILSELNNRCLILGDQRPVLANRIEPRHPDNPPIFFGHLNIGRPKSQKQHNVIAVSTSHYSQKNTIEYEMAAHWWALQKKSTITWDALHEQQAMEMKSLVSRLNVQNTN